MFAWIVSPVTWLLNRSANAVLRSFGQEPAREEENVHSPEELRILVEQSQEVGALERQDAALIEGVFEFSEKNAREVMTPRTAIDALRRRGDARRGGGARRGDAALALPGVRGDARQHHRPRAGEGPHSAAARIRPRRSPCAR